jgi:hypothetical protein
MIHCLFGLTLLADIPPPPTFVIDSLYLGWPLGPIVGLALAAAAVTAFIWLARRGVRKWVAVLLCLLVYGAANFGLYLYGLETSRVERDRYREKVFRFREEAEKKAVPTSSEK